LALIKSLFFIKNPELGALGFKNTKTLI